MMLLRGRFALHHIVRALSLALASVTLVDGLPVNLSSVPSNYYFCDITIDTRRFDSSQGVLASVAPLTVDRRLQHHYQFEGNCTSIA